MACGHSTSTRDMAFGHQCPYFFWFKQKQGVFPTYSSKQLNVPRDFDEEGDELSIC